jgi:hypothetical protein
MTWPDGQTEAPNKVKKVVQFKLANAYFPMAALEQYL